MLVQTKSTYIHKMRGRERKESEENVRTGKKSREKEKRGKEKEEEKKDRKKKNLHKIRKSVSQTQVSFAARVVQLLAPHDRTHASECPSPGSLGTITHEIWKEKTVPSTWKTLLHSTTQQRVDILD